MVTVNRGIDGAKWRTSSRSNQQGECVEVATNVPGVVAVRDAKNRDGGTLMLSPAAWSSFLDGVKSGEFDI
jgi:uncharacterized protein DUF397